MKVGRAFERLAAVVLLGGLCGTAHAQLTISVNFTGGEWLLTPTESAGILPATNWNNVIGGSGTNVALNDGMGNATTALLAFTSSGDYDGYGTPTTTSPGTNTLYSGGIIGDSSPSEAFVQLTNIPYADYRVYVYASNDSFSQVEMSDSDGPTTYYYESGGAPNFVASSLLQTTSTDSASPTIGPAQYQVFSGLTGPTFTLSTDGAVHGTITNNVFGIEVVSAPEPPTLPLMVVASCIALGSALNARRRRGVRFMA